MNESNTSVSKPSQRADSDSDFNSDEDDEATIT